MVAALFKGHEAFLQIGPEGSEETVGKVQSFTTNISNNLVSLFVLGSRTASVIKEENLVHGGTFSKAWIDQDYLAKHLGSTKKINFVGINKGGSTHTIFDKLGTTAETDAAPGSWAGAEIESTDYDMVEADDAADYDLTSNTDTNDFPALLIKFDNITTEANIGHIEIEVVGYATADSGSTQGFNLYAYDAANTEWDLIGSTETAAAQGSIVTIIPDPDDHVDASNDIFFMIRPQTAYDGSTASVIHLDYVELRVHDTTKSAEQRDFGLVTKYYDGTNTITLTFANVKLTGWSSSVTNDGTTILENVTWSGKTLVVT